MTDLIFHIGFPKCASTTLQNAVFPKEPGYLGTQKNMPAKRDFAKRFQTFSPLNWQIEGNMKQAEKWAKDVILFRDSIDPAINQMIASSEMFTNKNKIHPRPIISFLQTFSQKYWPYGKIKIIIIIRNQAERLSSNYAQMSSINANGSQTDYEKYVRKYLETKSEEMSYYNWVKELQNSFGKENVCVLLMEEIKTIEFWNNLKEFCNLSNFDPNSMLQEQNVYSKKTNKNTWLIEPFDASTKAKIHTKQIFSIFWPVYISQSIRQKVVNFSIKVAKLYFSNPWINRKVSRRGSEIKLTMEIRNMIQSKDKESTTLLSTLLNKDLTKLGY